MAATCRAAFVLWPRVFAFFLSESHTLSVTRIECGCVFSEYEYAECWLFASRREESLPASSRSRRRPDLERLAHVAERRAALAEGALREPRPTVRPDDEDRRGPRPVTWEQDECGREGPLPIQRQAPRGGSGVGRRRPVPPEGPGAAAA